MDKYIEAVNQMIADGQVAQDVAEKYFPELAESEDERIKGIIKNTLKSYNMGIVIGSLPAKDYADCLAWLEKQKPADKVEPKFKVADEIVPKNGRESSFTITKITDTEYYSEDLLICNIKEQDDWELAKEPKFKIGDWLVANESNNYARFVQILDIINVQGKKRYKISRDTHNDEHIVELRFIENHFHVFNIQDAKDGDVLMYEGYYNSIVLFHGIGINGEGRINYHCKCDLGNYSFSIQGDVACLSNIESSADKYHPASKEQRDLLFQKMHEAGYKWDEDKKELRKIEQKPISSQFTTKEAEILDKHIDKLVEWSEEDEKNIHDILNILFHSGKKGSTTLAVWLKSLRAQKIADKYYIETTTSAGTSDWPNYMKK